MMKGKISVVGLIVMLLLTFSVKAQEGFKIGAIILPQYSLMMNQDDMDAPEDVFKYKHTFGMAGGIMAGYNFNDHLGVRINAIYSSQGQKYSNVNTRGDLVNRNLRLDYIKVPVMVGFNTNTEFNKVVFSIYAGFQAGALVKAKYWDDDESYTPDQALVDNVTNYPTPHQQYRFIDYGPVVDFGLDVKLTYNLMANLHLRADYSLVDAENKDAHFELTSFGQTNDVLIYPTTRPETTTISGGLMLGITYTFSSY